MGKTSGSEHLSASEVQEFASANDPVLRAKVKGDSFERIRVEADGTVVTGDGTATPATALGASVLSTLFTNLDSNQASPSQGDPLIWDQPADLLVGADAAVNATNANIIDILTDGVYVVSLELVYQCSTDAEGRLQVRSSFNIADGDSLWGWINGREVVGVIHPTATGSSGDKYNYTWTLAPSALQAGDTLAFEVWPFLGAGTVTVTNDSGLSVVRIADLPLV